MKPESSDDSYYGLLGLDELRNEIKILNLIVCLIVVTFASVAGFFHINDLLLPNETPSIYYWIALISPSCIAAGWLRLTGLKWSIVILFFVFAWLAYRVVFFIYNLLGWIFMAT